jgi:hypothetical protein
VPEFIDPVFTKTSPKRSFSVIQNKRFGLVFAKTGSIISGTGVKCNHSAPQSRQSAMLLLKSSELGLPHPQPLTPVLGGGTHSLAREGLGESHRREGIYTLSAGSLKVFLEGSGVLNG